MNLNSLLFVHQDLRKLILIISSAFMGRIKGYRVGKAELIFYKWNNMGSHVDQIQARLLKKDAQGNPLLLITGQESLEELRKLIIEFSQACPAKQKHLQCPFFIMSSLSYGSLTNVVNNLPREACLDLFQMELDCRTQATAPCSSEDQKNCHE